MTTTPSLAQISLSLQEIEVLEGAVANAILHAEAHIGVVSKGGPAEVALRRQLQVLIGLPPALARARFSLTTAKKQEPSQEETKGPPAPDATLVTEYDI